MMQKISIITINYNNAAGLAATIQSVQAQNYPAIEYIIIDGGSTDGSATLVEELPVKPQYFVSEPDNGIFHAMNKGIQQATGEYLLFLNSGDYLLDQTGISSIFSENQTAGILYAQLHTEKGNIIYPAILDFTFFFKDSIGHPASFIRKELFDRFGKYNESYRIVSDWEFFLRTIIREKVSTRYFNFPLTFYNLEGMSNDSNNIELQLKERAVVLKEYFEKYYPLLLEKFFSNERELNLFKNSRAVSLLSRLMKNRIYKLVLRKK